MRRLTRLVAGLALAGALTAPAARAMDFHVGDLYLVSGAIPVINNAILKIDPISGSVTTLVHLPFIAFAQLNYDAYRDRLLTFNGGEGGTGNIVTVDAFGNVAQIAPTVPTPGRMTPRGDGIIYLYYGFSGSFRYLDASNNVHDLLNQSGTARDSLGATGALQEFYYDVGTNSLICFNQQGLLTNICPDVSKACAFKIPLMPSGTQVAGPPVAVQVEISTSGETVVGATGGPSGGVLWTVDTNSNAQEPRMQLLNPATMTSVTWASNGPYTGAAATNAGTYSSVRGQAVVLDTFVDSLRAFSFGGTGYGTEIAGGVSSNGGSGEAARLIEITNSPYMTGVDRPGGANAAAGRGAITFTSASPNPFTRATQIGFALAAPGPVTLEIHDAAGRRVRTLLAASSLAAGDHTANWDGKDAAGHQVAPGIYFARLSAPGATGASAANAAVQKLVVSR